MKTQSYYRLQSFIFRLHSAFGCLSIRLYKNRFISAAMLLSTVISPSCNSTRIVNSWRDPETMVSLEKLNKVLVVAFLRDEASRRVAEGRMAELLKGKAIPSYGYLGEDIKSLNEAGVRERLQGDSFDGAVVMRLVDVTKEVNYTPGNINTYPFYFRSFGGYYRRGWSYYSTPDRYHTTRSYSVETNVYSMKQDKLIWTGLTETTDPGGVDKLVAEISSTIFKRMMDEGFITE